MGVNSEMVDLAKSYIGRLRECGLSFRTSGGAFPDIIGYSELLGRDVFIARYIEDFVNFAEVFLSGYELCQRRVYISEN